MCGDIDMKGMKAQTLVAAIAVMLAPGQLWAAGRLSDYPASEPARTVAPGFYPTISVGVSSSSNARLATRNQQRDTAVFTRPGVYYRKDVGKHTFDIGADVEIANYKDFSSEDLHNYAVVSRLGLDLTPLVDVNAGVGYERNTDERDLIDRATLLSAEPSDLRRWKHKVASAELKFGRRENRMQIVVAGTTGEYRYLDEADNARERDHDGVKGTVYYNVGSRTRLALEGSSTDIDYVSDASKLDNTDDRVMLGVEIGGRVENVPGMRNSRRNLNISGSRVNLKAGSVKKDMVDPSKEDFSGTGYEANIFWKPIQRSTIHLSASRLPYESIDKNQPYLIGESLGAEWQHELTRRLRSALYVSTRDDNYSSSARADTLTNYGARLVYDWKRWLGIGLSYGHDKRDSNVENAAYNNDSVMLELVAGRRN